MAVYGPSLQLEEYIKIGGLGHLVVKSWTKCLTHQFRRKQDLDLYILGAVFGYLHWDIEIDLEIKRNNK